jgi:YidC/Oxa1 family membrane protein insertase
MQSQDPDQQKNLLLAVVLSMAVLLAWQIFYAGPKVKEEQKRAVEQSQSTAPGSAQKQAGSPPAAVPEGTVPGAATVPAPTQTREEALKDSPRLPIETPSLRGSIALKSGRVDDLVLKKYQETVDPNSPDVVLLSPTNSPHPYFSEYGWVAQGAPAPKLPDRDTLWSAEGSPTLTPANPVTLTWDNGAGLLFKRTVSVDDNYMFKIVDAVENRGTSPVTLASYARIYRYGTPKIQGYWILHEGLIGVADHNVSWCGSVLASVLCQVKYKDALKEGAQNFDSTGGWVGITDKYWAATVIPDQKAPFHAQFKGIEPATANEQPAYQASYLRDPIAIPVGESRSVEAHLFAGAKQVKLLQQYQEDPGILKFDLLIDWGWFFFITKPLYYLMEAINSVVHNFGVTIIILTVMVRLAFFPLANKQFASMAKMKKLQPQMEQLRERFKDDKAGQQQALMDLYKKEKVNPIAGCLPIVFQLPVFFALYKVLFITIDMRHAPFFGWIQDLSAPDPTSLFNLFGLLPFAAPAFLHIGVWPLIMGITMWLQMQLNPQQPDPVQQQIFSWMPVVFTFLLASFPAGLVIYWAWSNTLSLSQQYFIMKRQGVEVHLIGNISRTFAPLANLAGMLKQRFAGPPATPDPKSDANKPKDKHG